MLNDQKVGQYQIGERTLYLRPLKGKQMQQFYLFKDTTLTEIVKSGKNGFELFANLNIMATLFSIGLTDEHCKCVTVTVEEVGDTDIEVIAEVWKDFFFLYPTLMQTIIAWFLATLNLVEAAENNQAQAGAEPTSGSTSSP